MQNNIFPLLILNARPAAGKTEMLRALNEVPLETRIARFGIGRMLVLDDFPMIWAWFEEDRLLEQVFHRPRLHTTSDEYFLHHDLWHLLIRRLCLGYEKWDRDSLDPHTVVLEFSRGCEHGGYQAAYQHLSHTVLERAAILYLSVSYEESIRKNKSRFNPNRPDSLLQHGLSDEKIQRLYRTDDWDELTRQDPAFVHVGDHRIPYAIFENEDDVTTRAGETMLGRLEKCMGRLWSLKYPGSTV
jgi:hypothetical protein